MSRNNKFSILLVAVVFMATAGLRAQQEHPKKEHPTKEHPATKPISTAELEKAIREQIDEQAKAAGGKFRVQDDVLHKTWALELVRVHSDKLTQLDEKTYFACVDFRAGDGTMVDVDFYAKNENGKLKFSDTTVHKVNGKSRFNYQQRGNFWERVKVGG
jgi:hypothetical protein